MLLRCNCVCQGLNPLDAAVTLRDAGNELHFLAVPIKHLERHNGHYYLPVDMHVRAVNGRHAVDLLYETDKGVSRIWVHPSAVLEQERKK